MKVVLFATDNPFATEGFEHQAGRGEKEVVRIVKTFGF